MADKGQPVIETMRVEKLACIECQYVMDVFHLPSFSEIKCPACSTNQTIPAKFGLFLLLSRLGFGGMGVIFHAVDRELGRHVALKVMKRSLGDNSEFVKSFKHEAQAAAALNHRNVVQIYSFGQVEGQPYIVMELVDGGRLDEMIGGGVVLDETRALEIHLEVTAGLNAASQVGLVHGDIKPANILFGQTGEAKVVDFGLASFIGQQQQQQEGQVWGTPYYIAPEKARGKKVDFRSDIYSLGATLFHVLAGEPPFDGPTPMEVVTARLNHSAPSLLTLQPDLHPLTVAMVARMLEAEPTMRYPSYEALLVDMRAALNSSRVPLKKSGSKSAVFTGILAKKSLLKHLSWKIVGLAAGGVALILLMVGGNFWGCHQGRTPVVARVVKKQSLAEFQARGRDTLPRINALAQTIMDNAAPLLLMEEKANQLGKTVPESESAMIELREVVEYVMAAVNDVEDHQAFAQSTFQALEATTNLDLARKQADCLESSFNTLIASYNAIEESKARVTDTLAKAVVVQKRIHEAMAQVRKAEAEVAAKKREAEAVRQRALKQAKEAEIARPIITQRELDLVDEARAANASFIAQRQFDEAVKAMARLQPDMTMEESQAYCQAVTDSYQAMSKVKLFLVRSIQGAPYPKGWISGDATRDIVEADANKGIMIAVGSVGKLLMTWDQVNIQQMLKITRYYMDNPNISDKERAELILGVALFCYESGVFKMAETGALAAYRLDPAIKGEIQRLMPELFVEP
ncbi:MAG: protein kinase [Verrucomicrobia bacterium]|nr:protein kinase [Verrucomicrobiota bacterium]MBU4290315.1 protein kinase [Verrucomicrobiota bacterium]MBU4428029.1 protein kinase [Verrucomicrobiota bacterium]MCG2679525.1 protein kinase [Kiritimatiellia bacterium]